MTSTTAPASRQGQLADQYFETRGLTEVLAAPLSGEDQGLQSMPDASPTKWHRGHTSWFFETFVLEPTLGYRPFDPRFRYLFNSYYEGVGPRPERAERGLVSRPDAAEIGAYRRHVDDAMRSLLSETGMPDVADLVELGIHHEQQHQELLVMDIKHALSKNPFHPSYLDVAPPPPHPSPPTSEWLDHSGGRIEIGTAGGFAFDNEGPRHDVVLQPFALAAAPVSNHDWLAFIDDGGYQRSELWLSEGWATVQAQRWNAPLYWSDEAGAWRTFTLAGDVPVDLHAPVCHISLFEADAYARWAGHRLPTEAEWEALASTCPVAGQLLDPTVLQPTATRGGSLFGSVWQWTTSSYGAYPGFRPAPGAVGEYNGKFMVNQYVLRGGSCATPAGHVRASYRNFFPAHSRWAFSGVRVATDA